MLWFFERRGERLKCEIRPSPQTAGFELEWTEGDQVHIERSDDADELARRWVELEQKWKQEGWIKLSE